MKRHLKRELGAELPERRRTGATMSASGRDLLPHTIGVSAAVDRPRTAAGEQHRVRGTVRVRAPGPGAGGRTGAAPG
ncbi:hypothetical protein PV408_33545, partial [Streptomyces sp. ME18-1-4]|nr:hypothetical protein [Streptomyces sp. ME18-1-4]